jgi:hypothetical protein
LHASASGTDAEAAVRAAKMRNPIGAFVGLFEHKVVVVILLPIRFEIAHCHIEDYFVRQFHFDGIRYSVSAQKMPARPPGCIFIRGDGYPGLQYASLQSDREKIDFIVRVGNDATDV